MADEVPLSYLFDVLSFKIMATVSFPPASVPCFAVMLKAASSESQPLVPPLRLQLTFLILAIVMGCMTYIWDYILMFSMEVDLVWKSKWSFMKGLYLFQRYLPFIDITTSLYCQSHFP